MTVRLDASRADCRDRFSVEWVDMIVQSTGCAAAFVGRVALRFPGAPGPAHVAAGDCGEDAGRVPVSGPALGAARKVSIGIES